MGPNAAVPVPFTHMGPLGSMALSLHHLYAQGRYDEVLDRADEYQWIAESMGDRATARVVLQSHVYVLTEMGRYAEAETVGRELLRRSRARAARAKASADLADVLVRMGRLEDGLHLLASAMTILETSPRDWRYFSAMSSVVEPARWAEMYELADVATLADVQYLAADPERRITLDGQRAESLLEWALRLEHVGLADEADARFRHVIRLAQSRLELPIGPVADSERALVSAVLACALAKTGQAEEARAMATAAIPDLHADGRLFDARLAHLAYGLALRSTGEYEAAARELTAAEQMCASAGAGARRHQLIFQFELALLAAEAFPGPATGHLVAALRAHAEQLWRVRLDRVAMLRQARRRVQLEAAHASADAAAQTDPLTGLANRRGFDRRMAELSGQHPAGEQLCLLLIDLDNFKQINDGFSHATGDAVLREIGHALRAQCRASDLPARFGGDEFGVFLAADLPTATRIAARMRTLIRGHDWHTVALGLTVTVSMGLAALLPGMTSEDLFAAADVQLYEAKRAGRDRLVA